MANWKQKVERRLPQKLFKNLVMPVRIGLVALFRKGLDLLGYNVVRKDDYYSPLPVLGQLQSNIQRWNRPSRLTGITYDLNAFKQLSQKLVADYYAEFARIPSYETLTAQDFGPGYSSVDALTLYAMIRHFKPRRYIEIGSGISTYYSHLAGQENARQGDALQITCIEPFPYPALQRLPDVQLQVQEVQNVDPSFFQQLAENDILFIDSSHVLKIDGDVQYLYLEVLPALADGVLIHIHDVPFPYNIPYPPEFWLFQRAWPKFWNEAMVLQAFLSYNPRYRIVLSTPLLRYHDEAFLRQLIPFYPSIDQNPNTFSAIWLQKTSPSNG